MATFQELDAIDNAYRIFFLDLRIKMISKFHRFACHIELNFLKIENIQIKVVANWKKKNRVYFHDYDLLKNQWLRYGIWRKISKMKKKKLKIYESRGEVKVFIFWNKISRSRTSFPVNVIILTWFRLDVDLPSFYGSMCYNTQISDYFLPINHTDIRNFWKFTILNPILPSFKLRK